MSFVATHRRNIIGITPIGKNEIQPGDILEFRYKTSKGNDLQLVLALGSILKDKERKLHAIKIENISLNVFKRILVEMVRHGMNPYEIPEGLFKEPRKECAEELE